MKLSCLPPALALVATLVAAPATRAQSPDEVQSLRAEIAALRRDYDERLAALERRLAALPAPVAPPPADDLATLRAAAVTLAGEAPPAPAANEAPVGGERNLSRLNPEISFTGDLVASGAEGDRQRFSTREFELDFQSALDPFSATKWTVAVTPEGEVDVEEGYIAYRKLPAGTELLAGRFRQSFGVLNRWHQHALPQADYPLVVSEYFGDEGLAQTGLSLSWLLPRPWASANELTVQVTDGDGEAFGGERFRDLVALAHLKNYWDLSPATYLEWGLSGVSGRAPGGGRSRVLGTDLTLHWQPPARAKYRELTWRGELLRSERPGDDGRARRAWGGYGYLEGLLARNWSAGARYDRVEDALAPERTLWGVSPYLTWWQSEYVRLRAEYQHRQETLPDARDRRLLLQITWAAGPHKHEAY